MKLTYLILIIAFFSTGLKYQHSFDTERKYRASEIRITLLQ